MTTVSSGPTPAVTATTAGVLRPDDQARSITLRRHPVAAPAGRWVENHWSLRWDLSDGRSFVSAWRATGCTMSSANSIRATTAR